MFVSLLLFWVLADAGLIDGLQDGFWTNYCLRKDNIYIKRLLGNLKDWINDDEIVLKDLQKAKKVDRKKVCSRRK